MAQNSSTALALQNPLWDYALRLYALPGVEKACLSLQNQHGLPVNQLIFAGWLAHIPKAFESLPSDSWVDEVTGPLRTVRYRVRAELARQPPVADLYRLLKQAELAAEQVELARLYRLSSRWPVAEDCPAQLVWSNLAKASGFNRADAPAALLEIEQGVLLLLEKTPQAG